MSLPVFASPRATEPKTDAWDTPSRRNSFSWLRSVSSTSSSVTVMFNLAAVALGPGEFDSVLQQVFVVAGVEVVFDADVLLQAGAFAEHETRVDHPGFCEHAGVFHCDVVVDLVFVDASVTFYDVQLIGVKCSGAYEPGLIVEAGDVDNEGVSFPVRD